MTRAQQRAAAIDVSPAKLAAEIERLARERDLARRQAELARDELARIRAAGSSLSPARRTQRRLGRPTGAQPADDAR